MAGPSKGSLFDGQYRAVTPHVEWLVRTIRETYLVARKGYISHAPLRASKAADDHFLQTAFLVQKLGVDPVEFTLRQVAAMAETGNIFPNGLHSLKVYDRQPKAETITTDSLASYTAQNNLLHGLRTLFTLQQAISDPMNQFSPLFRACVALRLGLTEVASRHRDEAKRELALNPVMRTLFPKEVAQL